MYYLIVDLSRPFTMDQETRKRRINLLERLKPIVMERPLCFSVMDGVAMKKFSKIIMPLLSLFLTQEKDAQRIPFGNRAGVPVDKNLKYAQVVKTKKSGWPPQGKKD